MNGNPNMRTVNRVPNHSLLLRDNMKHKITIMKLKHAVLTTILTVATVAFSMAQSLDEVISKHLDAMGGADNLRKVHSLVMKGNINQGGTKIPITISAVQKKAFRVEFSFNGMTGYQILTDTAGWGFNPFMGQTKPEPMTQDEVKKSQDQLDLLDELLDYQDKGTTLQDLGTDDVEGTECYKIKATLKNGKERTLYISKEDYLTIRSTEKTEINGKELEATTDFSNYKKVGDVLMPFSVNNSVQGPVDIDTIEINPTIDEAIFKPQG